MDISSTLHSLLRILYVVLVFCSAFILGLIKGLLVGPIAGLILAVGNIWVILGLFPPHVIWTCYSLIKTNKCNAPLKVAILLALPALFGIYLALSIGGSFLVGVGYGFFAPWVLTFEAFRNNKESKKFMHCIMDGTWGAIRGSWIMVRDFADLCYHSYPAFLEELRTSPGSHEMHTIRLHDVPACILVALMGLIVDIPLYTLIVTVKSPYMLFKGWFRLIHDLISREGPFLETACIPIAGLAIILWPVIVIASILGAIFLSFFVGLYGSVVVYQERSFRSGVAFVISMVAEFDEYTNDRLYLREGTILPNQAPLQEEKASQTSESSAGGMNHSSSIERKLNATSSAEAPAMLVPRLAHSRSVKEVIQELKMVQIWENMMKSYEMKGKQLVDLGIIKPGDLDEWLRAKNSGNNNEAVNMVGIGIPCASLLHTLLHSIKAGSDGLLMLDNIEVTYLNRPKNDKLLDWFFNPVLVLKEQIRAVRLEESEKRFLEELVVFRSNPEHMNGHWEDGGNLKPLDNLRAAQIQGISRRMVGIIRSVSKLPTYRRRFRQIVKALVAYTLERDLPVEGNSSRFVNDVVDTV